jgi:hypothetical protein
MKPRILGLILSAMAFETLIVACVTLTAEPAPTSLLSVTPAATQTSQPTPTFTSTALPVTATPLPPTQTATRTQLPIRTRAPATPTSTRAPLLPPEWDVRLDALDIKLIPATVQAGQLYWRLTKTEFWDEKERQGKHHIFINVLDERGVRIIGQKVIVEWPDEKLVLVTEDKPAPEYSANYPLDINHYPPWGTLGAFTASVDGLPSEKVAGMGLPSRNIFVVYLLTFQRTQR